MGAVFQPYVTASGQIAFTPYVLPSEMPPLILFLILSSHTRLLLFPYTCHILSYLWLFEHAVALG